MRVSLGARAASLLFLLLTAAGGVAAPQGHVAAELVAEDAAIRPGVPFWVGVKLSMDREWHVYWKNPGDSGLPTTVQWRLPTGFSAEPLLWPSPQRFPLSGEATYGYTGQTLLLARVTPPPQLPAGSTVGLSASVGWLACKVECIPGQADVSLSLPVSTGAATADSRWTRDFAAARARLPAVDASARVGAQSDQKTISLRIDGLALGEGTRAYFFPEAPGMIAAAPPQVLERTGGGFTLRLPRVDTASATPLNLDGVLAIAKGPPGAPADGPGPVRAVSLSVKLGRGAPPAPASASLPLLLAVLFAFLGGLILNLMPCVLPVLSLKVLGFVREAHSAPRRALVHGLVFTAGVVLSFWALLGALLALRAGGNLLGWGFQFQDPGVVTVMAVLVFVLGLNMFGVFEIGARAAGVGAGVRGRSGLAGSFSTGILATLVATPCTAPFMGSALGFALTQPALSAFLVFTALGAGMAAPSLVLSASPRLLARVPKPGKWMETLKQALGFLMVATVVWLGFVLAALAGAGALTSLFIALAAAALGAWIYGRWGGIDRGRGVRAAAAVLGILLVVGGAAVAVTGAAGSAREQLALASAGGGVTRGNPGWQPFTPARLAELRAAGTPVFVDFGAEWCLTCKVNERVALYNPAVEKRFAELGVARLRADWTDRSDTIARALAGYGRSGVPLYVLYGPGAQVPALLPEIVTPGIVLAALDREVGGARSDRPEAAASPEAVPAAAGATAPAGVSAPAGATAPASGEPSAIEKAFSQ